MLETITAQINEKEIITVNFTEKEIVKVNFKVLDVIQYYRKYVESGVVKESAIMVSEFPTKDFKTSLEFVPGTLSVFLNGLREKWITITGIKSFSLPIDAINGDSIEIEYTEKI